MFKNLFAKEHWKLVHTIEDKSMYFVESKQEISIMFYLFESDRCNRKYSVKYNQIIGKNDNCAERTDVYMKQVEPWLLGRNDPKIQRYADVAEEDVMNYLRGSR